MHTHLSFTGTHCNPYREHRLCGYDEAPDRSGTRVEGYSSFEDFVERIPLIGDREERDKKISLQKMRDGAKWKAGFQETIKDDTVKKDLPKDYGPVEWLHTLQPAERRMEFARYIQATIPQAVRAANAGHPLFKGRDGHPVTAFVTNDPSLLNKPDVRAQLEKVTPEMVNKLLNVVALLAGEDVPEDADVKDLAGKSAKEMYAGDGRIFRDYESAVKGLKNDRPEPTAAQLRDAKFLLGALPPGPLRGYLRITPIAEAQERINRVADQLAKHDKEIEENRLSNLLRREDVDKETRLDVQRRTNSAMNNFDQMEPWQKLAVGGIAVLTLSGTFWKKLGAPKQLSWVSWILVGMYGYQRLIAGDSNALENMTNFFQRNVLAGQDIIARRSGLVGDRGADRDIQRIIMMEQFFNEKAYERIYPTGIGFMAMSEVKLGSIAQVFDYKAGKPALRAAPGSKMHSELEAIIKHRGYDRRSIYKFLTGSTESKNGVDIKDPTILRAMQSFFFMLGSKDARSSAVLKQIEKARLDAATPSNPRPSYFDIKGPMLNEVHTIVRRGQATALMPPNNTLSLADVMGRMVASRAIQDR